jgi:hypothetical protein
MKKMKKIFYILAISLLLPTTSLFSQKAGYMGKRFIINAELNTSTAWFRPNAYGNKGFFSFNYIASPSIEFIAHNKIAVGAVYNYSPGMFEFRVEKNSTSGEIYETSDNTFIAHGAGIYGKFYLRRSTAPMGSYIKTELDWFFYNYNIKPVPQAEGYMSGVKGTGNMGGFKIEFGRDFMFFNRLRVSTSVNVGIPFGGYKNSSLALGRKFIPYITTDSYYAGESLVAEINGAVTARDFVNTQILSQYVFGIKIGIGFLAF